MYPGHRREAPGEGKTIFGKVVEIFFFTRPGGFHRFGKNARTIGERQVGQQRRSLLLKVHARMYCDEVGASDVVTALLNVRLGTVEEFEGSLISDGVVSAEGVTQC